MKLTEIKQCYFVVSLGMYTHKARMILSIILEYNERNRDLSHTLFSEIVPGERVYFNEYGELFLKTNYCPFSPKVTKDTIKNFLSEMFANYFNDKGEVLDFVLMKKIIMEKISLASRSVADIVGIPPNPLKQTMIKYLVDLSIELCNKQLKELKENKIDSSDLELQNKFMKSKSDLFDLVASN